LRAFASLRALAALRAFCSLWTVASIWPIATRRALVAAAGAWRLAEPVAVAARKIAALFVARWTARRIWTGIWTTIWTRTPSTRAAMRALAKLAFATRNEGTFAARAWGPLAAVAALRPVAPAA
jgi:hypothetical protein